MLVQRVIFVHFYARKRRKNTLLFNVVQFGTPFYWCYTWIFGRRHLNILIQNPKKESILARKFIFKPFLYLWVSVRAVALEAIKPPTQLIPIVSYSTGFRHYNKRLRDLPKNCSEVNLPHIVINDGHDSVLTSKFH